MASYVTLQTVLAAEGLNAAIAGTVERLLPYRRVPSGRMRGRERKERWRQWERTEKDKREKRER